MDPARSSLEYGTKLVAPNMGQWTFVLYPDAAEGCASFHSAARSSGSGYSVEPAADSRPDAERRARGKVRRYCAANRLNRLGTLTYAGAGCHDPGQFREDLAGPAPALTLPRARVYHFRLKRSELRRHTATHPRPP